MTAGARPEGLSAYIAVTAAYWAFMLTDGALRMLVLLHFHTLGFTPVQLAYLFVLYEIAGMVTNLSAGWIAARFGLTSTLYAGLGLQVVALLALAQLDPAWAIGASVAFVMVVQGASGVAKDLAKMSSKSAVKLLAPTEAGRAFPLGRDPDRLEERGEGAGLPSRSSSPRHDRLRLGRARHGRRARRDPSRGSPRHAAGPAQGAKGRQVLRGVLEIGQRQLAVARPRVPVRGARRVVRRRHPDLFLRRAVGRHDRGQSRRLLRDRHLHGALDHPLRRGAGSGTETSCAQPARRRRDLVGQAATGHGRSRRSLPC